jgi:hypothetical protein
MRRDVRNFLQHVEINPCKMGFGFIRGSKAEVKERIELYLYSLSGPSWPVPGRNVPFKYIMMTKCKMLLHHFLFVYKCCVQSSRGG